MVTKTRKEARVIGKRSTAIPQAMAEKFDAGIQKRGLLRKKLKKGLINGNKDN